MKRNDKANQAELQMPSVEIYKIVRSGQQSWAQLHLEYLFRFLTLVGTFTGLTFVGIYNFRENLLFLSLVAVAGFGMNIFVCIKGKQICDRAYQRFLEEITIADKLEAILKLTESHDSFPPFSDDKRLLPERWLASQEKHRSAKMFVESGMKEGNNKLSSQIFWVLGIGNAMLLVVILGWIKISLMASLLQNLH